MDEYESSAGIYPCVSLLLIAYTLNLALGSRGLGQNSRG